MALIVGDLCKACVCKIYLIVGEAKKMSSGERYY